MLIFRHGLGGLPRGSLSQRSNSDHEKWNHTFVSDNLAAQGLRPDLWKNRDLNPEYKNNIYIYICISGDLSKGKSSNLDPDEKQHNIIPALKVGIR